MEKSSLSSELRVCITSRYLDSENTRISQLYVNAWVPRSVSSYDRLSPDRGLDFLLAPLLKRLAVVYCLDSQSRWRVRLSIQEGYNLVRVDPTIKLIVSHFATSDELAVLGSALEELNSS